MSGAAWLVVLWGVTLVVAFFSGVRGRAATARRFVDLEGLVLKAVHALAPGEPLMVVAGEYDRVRISFYFEGPGLSQFQFAGTMSPKEARQLAVLLAQEADASKRSQDAEVAK